MGPVGDFWETNKNNSHLENAEIANQITTRVDFSNQTKTKISTPHPQTTNIELSNQKKTLQNEQTNTLRMPQIKAYQITTRWVFVPKESN